MEEESEKRDRWGEKEKETGIRDGVIYEVIN